MKFVLYTDYSANAADLYGDYKYEVMEATDLEAAIDEADSKWNDSVYMMRIMKQTGKAKELEFKTETYTATLARRSYGWHRNNKENSESEHNAKRWIGKNGYEHIEIC